MSEPMSQLELQQISDRLNEFTYGLRSDRKYEGRPTYGQVLDDALLLLAEVKRLRGAS